MVGLQLAIQALAADARVTASPMRSRATTQQFVDGMASKRTAFK